MVLKISDTFFLFFIRASVKIGLKDTKMKKDVTSSYRIFFLVKNEIIYLMQKNELVYLIHTYIYE